VAHDVASYAPSGAPRPSTCTRGDIHRLGRAEDLKSSCRREWRENSGAGRRKVKQRCTEPNRPVHAPYRVRRSNWAFRARVVSEPAMKPASKGFNDGEKNRTAYNNLGTTYATFC
jgi:hypothetical protein